MVAELKIKRTENSKLSSVDFNNLPFGKVFSDHLFQMDYNDGKWQEPQIIPYQDMSISPACSALHYGQSIFEGLKAERGPNGEILVFRPDQNFIRLNNSAERMGIPTIPVEDSLFYMKTLIELEQQWIPQTEGASLYIRPLLFGNDDFIGVRAAESYRYLIMVGPAGPYYAKPVNVYIEDFYVRAAKGGIGEAKTAGNYAASLKPMQEAAAKGFDQILWTDAKEHKYVQEAGTMNAFFIIDGVVITPNLDGTILPGITRNSFIQLFKDAGYTVEERQLSVDEIIDASERGILNDAFGAGTAAVLIPFASLSTKDKKIELPPLESRTISKNMKERFVNIKKGLATDKYNWLYKI